MRVHYFSLADRAGRWPFGDILHRLKPGTPSVFHSGDYLGRLSGICPIVRIISNHYTTRAPPRYQAVTHGLHVTPVSSERSVDRIGGTVRPVRFLLARRSSRRWGSSARVLMQAFRASWRFVFIAYSLLITASISLAQIDTVNNSTSTPVPGAGHNYIGSLNETVDPGTGSVSVRIDVGAPSGRGITLPFSFAYDSNGVHFPKLTRFATPTWGSSLTQTSYPRAAGPILFHGSVATAGPTIPSTTLKM